MPFHLVHPSLLLALPHSSPVRSCQSDVCIPTEQMRELGWVGRECQLLSPLHGGKWLLVSEMVTCLFTVICEFVNEILHIIRKSLRVLEVASLSEAEVSLCVTWR